MIRTALIHPFDGFVFNTGTQDIQHIEEELFFVLCDCMEICGIALWMWCFIIRNEKEKVG